MRCIGAGARTKKVAFLGIKVYAVAVYAEAEKAARELGIRARQGSMREGAVELNLIYQPFMLERCFLLTPHLVSNRQMITFASSHAGVASLRATTITALLSWMVVFTKHCRCAVWSKPAD